MADASFFKIRKHSIVMKGSFDLMSLKLSQLRQGQKGVIKNFNKDEIFLKLLEMGCVPGEMVTIEQIAPLGDPISVSVAGYSLSLRKNEAESIDIELIDNQ